MSKETKSTIEVDQQIVTDVEAIETTTDKFKIKNEDQYDDAVRNLGTIKAYKKSVDAKIDDFMEPIKKQTKNVKDTFKPFADRAEKATSKIKEEVVSYRDRLRSKNEKKIADIEAKIESGEMKSSVGVRKISKLELPESSTKVDGTTLIISKIKKIDVIDETKIPAKYKFTMIDSKKLKEDAVKIHALQKEGIEVEQIEGVVVTESEQVSVR